MNENMKMLIVDDSPDNLLVLSSLVREYFPVVEILTAGDAVEGLRLAFDAKVDCALIDVQMPGMNGIELCWKLKSDPRTDHIALILLTAHSAGPQLKARGLEAGADDFINRPFDNVEFVARVKVLLRVKRAEDGLRKMNECLEAQVAEKVAGLQKSEERLRNISQNSREWVWEVDTEGVYTYSSPSVEMLGYSPEEVVGKKHFSDFFHPGERAELKNKAFATFVMKQSFHEFINRCINKEGETVWLSTSGLPVLDNNGDLIGYRGADTNITERIRAENLQSAQLSLVKYAQTHSEQEFLQQFLAEAEALTESTVGFCHLLEEDQETISSQVWSKKTLGIMCAVVEHDRHSPILQAGVWVDCIHQRQSVIHNDYANLNPKKGLPEGHVPIIRELVVPVFRGDKITAVLGVGNKKTLYTQADVLCLQRLADVGWETVDRKRGDAERRLLQSAIEYAAEAIVITDKDAVIQYVNPAFEEMSGYTRMESIGKNPRFLKGEQNQTTLYRDLWNQLGNHEAWHGRFENRKKDGTLYTEEVRISPVLNTVGEITNYIAVKNDISHALELEDQLRQSQKIQAVGQLAGGIAHDFNNMLTIILGYGYMTLTSLPRESRGSRNVEKMVTAAQKAEKLIGQLLAFSRKQVLNSEIVDLNYLVTDFSDLLNKLLFENIQLILNLSKQPIFALVDPTQAEQILINLVVNARDAIGTKEGEIYISIGESVLPSSERGKFLADSHKTFGVITVKDDGCGIPVDIKNKIFDPFFTTKEQGRGTGLGLSTVYGIVKQSGGYLFVDSTVAEGSRFSVFLPLGSENEKSEIVQPANSTGLKSAKRILVIDDEELVLSILEQSLTREGHTVFVQRDSQEAFNFWQQKKGELDLVITDVGMPGMNGVDLANKILEIRADAKILFISGYGELHKQGDISKIKEWYFLQKPFSPEGLSQKIESMF